MWTTRRWCFAYSTGFPIHREVPLRLRSFVGLTFPPRAGVLVPKTQFFETIMTDYFDRLVFTIPIAWLSQSLQRLCWLSSILHFWRFIANPTYCLSVGQNCSGVGLLTAVPFIPTLTWVQVQRGASRLEAKLIVASANHNDNDNALVSFAKYCR